MQPLLLVIVASYFIQTANAFNVLPDQPYTSCKKVTAAAPRFPDNIESFSKSKIIGRKV